MFSSRVPADLRPNRLAQALARARAGSRALLDLTVSNPTDVGFEYPASLLSALAQTEGLRYDPAPLGLQCARSAITDDFRRRRGIAIDPARIVLTASTSEAYSVLFKLLADAGDYVLAPRPSYPLFDHLTRLDSIEAVAYPLEYHGVWSLDREAIASAAFPPARAVLVVNPNNPTGSYLKEQELRELARLCAERSLALIGDEVFFDYPIDGETTAAARRRVSVLEQNGALTFALGGLSKLVGLPQLKLAWIAVTGPRGLVEDALARLELICDTYLSVSTPVQLALPRLLAHGAQIREQIQRRVATNHRRLRELAAIGTAWDVLTVEGGWHAIVRIPATRPEEDVALDLLSRDDVIVHPGYFFDFPDEAFLVVSLLPPIDTFEEAAARMFRRLEIDA